MAKCAKCHKEQATAWFKGKNICQRCDYKIKHPPDLKAVVMNRLYRMQEGLVEKTSSKP